MVTTDLEGAAAEKPLPDGQSDQAIGRVFLLLVAAALVLAVARRLLFGLEDPLWLDEAYTGAIATQDNIAGLVKAMLRELGGPAYYSFMWLWVNVFGSSNLSLRMPSLLSGLLAPALILLSGHSDLKTKVLWAVLVALWIPSLYFAAEARAYTMLVLLGTAQVILFLRLIELPTLGRAAAWCGLSAIFILTHYHAALICGLQGLIYLAVWRQTALKTWPAALLFAPAAIWMAYHVPLVLRFSQPDFAWQYLLEPFDVLRFPNTVLAYGLILSPLPFVIVAATISWDIYLKLRKGVPLPYRTSEMLAAGAAMAAILIVFAWGFVRPSFQQRYLFPFIPGLLLGVAVWARAWSRRVPVLPHILVLGLMVTTALEMHKRAWQRDRVFWSWEQASQDLTESGARRLIFLWDSPSAEISGPDLLAEVGSFFFKRSGVKMPTEAVVLGTRRDVDPNLVLLKHADRPGDAVIWGYDRGIRRTLGIRYPARLDKLDPRFTCRDYGRSYISVVACIRR